MTKNTSEKQTIQISPKGGSGKQSVEDSTVSHGNKPIPPMPSPQEPGRITKSDDPKREKRKTG